MFDQMRNVLQPRGTAQIVRLAFDGGTGAAYFKKEFVHACIDLLEKKCVLAAAGVEPLNALEQLAAQVLKDSAYIKSS